MIVTRNTKKEHSTLAKRVLWDMANAREPGALRRPIGAVSVSELGVR
ncbi:MAG: hypothetical protein DHS20C08_14090 [Rhodomicrobium sp.]|nr:MAG: hypothetical protein DHS20C08_14090 [Rhodomicrobium sp.]